MSNDAKQNLFQDLEQEVQDLADESTANLLPLLFKRFVERHSLNGCARHRMLVLRRKAEILMTRNHQLLRNGIINQEKFEMIEKCALDVRRQYRSLPCTCWVTKR